MSTNTLNSDDFGIKIYNRFPPKYREDDVGQNYSLRRYLESLSDGGFKYAIDDINGITTLIDPDKVDAKVLPILFKQYGLDIFNGIPEEYLRYLLPKLGEAWSKKGSLGVVEFITSSLSGVKVSTDIVYEDDTPTINVKLEMDYKLGDYFPDSNQFNRLLENFIPFYCDVAILYSYFFHDSQSIFIDSDYYDTLIDFSEENLSVSSIGVQPENTSVLNLLVLGESVLGIGGENADKFYDIITENLEENINLVNSQFDFVALTNNSSFTLNNNFCTTTMSCYDKITVDGTSTIVY